MNEFEIGSEVVFRKPKGSDPTGRGIVCGRKYKKLRILVEWDDGIVRSHRLSSFMARDIVPSDPYKDDFMEKIKDRLNG